MGQALRSHELSQLIDQLSKRRSDDDRPLEQLREGLDSVKGSEQTSPVEFGLRCAPTLAPVAVDRRVAMIASDGDGMYVVAGFHYVIRMS